MFKEYLSLKTLVYMPFHVDFSDSLSSSYVTQ